MRQEKVKLSTVFLLEFGLIGLHAQTTTPATGGKASGSGGVACYSIGQVVYTTNTGINGSVAQGVLQPYEILEETGIEKFQGINLSVTAYPNPVTDNLILEVENVECLTLNVQLYDIQGKLLENMKILGRQTCMDLSNLVPATYFIKVFQGNSEVKIFKIIKH